MPNEFCFIKIIQIQCVQLIFHAIISYYKNIVNKMKNIFGDFSKSYCNKKDDVL